VGRLVARSLFNVSYHGVHHQFARMPYAALPEFRDSLTPAEPEESAPYRSYREAFGEVLRSLADPRIGPQWGEAPGAARPPARVRIGRPPGAWRGLSET
jgi:fatty acid desaturase